MRVNHHDRDMNDPRLQAVFCQRTYAGRRGRLGESDRADEQQLNSSGKQISPKVSTTHQTSGTLDVKSHSKTSPQVFSRPLYQKGDIVTLKAELNSVTARYRNRYTIDECVTPTAPHPMNHYYLISDIERSFSKWAHEDDLVMYPEDKSNRDNDLQVKTQVQSEELQNPISAEILQSSGDELINPLELQPLS